MQPVPTTGTWPIKWVQNTLQNFSQRFITIELLFLFLFQDIFSLLKWDIMLTVPCLQHLESVIRARIPSITSLINKSIDELESEMDLLGRPIAVDAGVSDPMFP